jgi:hypothetical protein
LPFIIRRPMPNGSSELWRLQDLEIICWIHWGVVKYDIWFFKTQLHLST